MTEVIRRFCEDDFAYAPRGIPWDGKVHLRKVTSVVYFGCEGLKGRSVIAPYRVTHQPSPSTYIYTLLKGPPNETISGAVNGAVNWN